MGDQANGVESNAPPGESVSGAEAFPTIPPEGDAWFDVAGPGDPNTGAG